MSSELIDQLINNFTSETATHFFRSKNPRFKISKEPPVSIRERDQFSQAQKLGEVQFADSENKLIVVVAQVRNPLSERSGKKAQYDFGCEILKPSFYDAGIFIFHDGSGNFRFSLIYRQYIGTKIKTSNFKRFTYYASPALPNKTFRNQIGGNDFTSLDKVKEAFSLAKVTNEFYLDFSKQFDGLCGSVKKIKDQKDAITTKDFALLFSIRILFLGFIQKRGWLGDDKNFMSNLARDYEKSNSKKDSFYGRWLRPLFFEALNSPPGRKVSYQDNDFPPHVEQAFQMAPFLNGGLFEEHELDKESYFVTDEAIFNFFDFLFSYNFTIEENTLYDEELELNPEFLGIIFERLVNKENGAVYTPRTEVDFMCRIALVKWLERNNTSKITLKDLYELFFLEGGINVSAAQQRRGDFTTDQKKELIDLITEVTVCDPAVGSGAFLVGMLHVLDEVEHDLRSRVRDPEYKLDAFQRKERIISKSLYGVEVKQWAVWITQLRLWITLFIDAPDSLRDSLQPILPSLDFKVRQGDSLVQRIGKKLFPVVGHANIPPAVKAKVTQLKELKNNYYQNKSQDAWEVRQAEFTVFDGILRAEINKKRNQLTAHLGELPVKQKDFWGEPAQEQLRLDLNKEHVATLKSEIKELEEELDALRSKDRPLVWNIEFAEIFSDKNGFDIIVGNPPYVRQEAIADPLGKIPNAKEYKDALAEMALGDFSREFKKEKINAQSDLYTYFYIRSLRLLNEKGIHVFICSNSWLDVGYGVWVQKFLLNYAPIHFIFDNHSKRSFAAADVNTIVSVIGAPVKKVDSEHMVKFVAFKLPFEEVVFTENLLEVERTREIVANEKFRVYPITNESLFKGGLEADEEAPVIAVTGKYIGDKWGGKYLRAPDIFFTILEKGKGKLIRLGDIADVRFGIKTGANEFFYLDSEEVKKWGIEKEFLKSVIKSPRECRSILLDPKELQVKALICNKTKDELKSSNVLKYIEAGERAVIEIRQGSAKGSQIKGFQNLESIKARKNWWQIGEQCGNIFWGKEIRERLATFVSNDLIAADCRLYYAVVDLPVKLLCNATIYYFFGEVLKRDLGGGGGPRSLMVYEVQDSLIVNPKLFSSKNLSGLDSFLRREVKTIFEECGMKKEKNIREQEPNPMPDRKRLDDIVFDAIGLTPVERKEVYWAVCELVKNRLDKARSV